MSGTIVVGVDGSAPSIDALRWAAAQSELTGSSLMAVTAWQAVRAEGWTQPNPQKDAETRLGYIIRRELKGHDGLDIQSRVIEGHPAEVLIEAAEHADLLVVGSRGHGAFASMMLGSVSLHCVAHARCPVVVVRHEIRQERFQE